MEGLRHENGHRVFEIAGLFLCGVGCCPNSDTRRGNLGHKRKTPSGVQSGEIRTGGQVDVSGHIKGAQRRRQIRTVGYRACRRQPQDFTNPLPGTVAELANCQCVPFPAHRHAFMWHPLRPQPAPGWGRFIWNDL